ncbi:transglutaminase-like domain-containing protein [Ruania albidiflava]|uniref:transglutaminase-like domain-containing protein n=1 Tax=Ruania albidiflava TaxID=366586 RepID=UPI0023F1E76E|nr:transglutaminase-like domain-containing protein [Ruania albidiflava]
MSADAAAPASRRERRVQARSWLTPLARWASLRNVLNAVVPVLLIGMAIAPLHAVYLDPALYAAVVGGLVLGGGIAVAGAAYRLGAVTMISVTVIVFFLFGALAAPSTVVLGVIPTPTTWQLMGVGMVTVWKHVLTVAPPLGAGGVVLLLPYLFTFVAAVVAVTISLRTRRLYSLSLALPAVVLMASILFGTYLSVLAGVLGVLAVVVAVTWVAWRADRLELNRVLAVTIVLAVAALGGTGASVFAAPTSQRVVLRDYVEPPPDPQDLPSPLAGFRNYADELADVDLFTVSGLPQDETLLRLAALDSYDGLVWSVTGENVPGSGVFRRIGERVEVEVPDDAYAVDVHVSGYDDVWVLNAGGTVDVNFSGADAADLSDTFYYNQATDTGLTTARLSEGDGFELVADPAAQVVPENVTELAVANITLPEPRDVPDAIGSLAGRYSADANSPYAKIEAIAESLSSYGFFSHGLEGEVPSRPGHGSARLQEMLDAEQIVGDEEQYAAAMALMVRALGYPARVVLGFDVTSGGTVTLTGEDVTAWVEVPFEGVGWVPFFPTPPEDQIPQAEDPDPADRPQPQVLQPPPPPEEPAEVPPQDRDDAEVDNKTIDKLPYYNRWVLIAGIGSGSLLVLLSPLLLILAIKGLRRRRRRTRGDTVDRITGGWDEVIDSLRDLGVATPSGTTRSELATQVDAQVDGADVLTLAREADRAVFAPEQPAEEHVTTYWAAIRRAASRVAAGMPWRRRMRARISTRSLRRRKR